MNIGSAGSFANGQTPNKRKILLLVAKPLVRPGQIHAAGAYPAENTQDKRKIQ